MKPGLAKSENTTVYHSKYLLCKDPQNNNWLQDKDHIYSKMQPQVKMRSRLHLEVSLLKPQQNLRQGVQAILFILYRLKDL